MKILKVRFKNINSLRGEHEIDFSLKPLSDSRLFAITGPTGSGKSSILDVIALALFNQVPRIGKMSNTVIEQGGAILTRNTEEAFASIDYQCAKGVYRSTWSISTNRNGHLRSYEMELADLELNKNFDLKKSAVPAKNEELIGLNYDQFIKSMMLAQGEFAKFLKVSKSERGELLEKITGTGIYRLIGKKAFEKKGLFAKRLEDLRKEKNVYEEQLLEKDELASNESQNKDFEKRVIAQEKGIRSLEDQLKLRAELADIEDGLKKAQISWQEKSEALKLFNDKHAKAISAHEASAPFAERLEDWKQNEKDIKELQTDAKRLKQGVIEKKQEISSLLRDVRELLKKEVDSPQLIKELDAFQEKVEALETQIKDKKQEFEGKYNVLVAHSENLSFNPDASKPIADLNEVNTLRQSTEKNLGELEADLVDFERGHLEEALEINEKKLSALGHGREWSAQLDKVISQIKEQQELLEKKQETEEKLPGELSVLRLKVGKAEAELKASRSELENQRLRASLEEHRAKLQENEPCPLCGSEDHPWAEHAPIANDVLAKSIKDMDLELKGLNKELNTKEAQQESIKNEKLGIHGQLKKLNNDKEALNQKLERECAEWLTEARVDWDGFIQKGQKQKKLLLTFSEQSKKLKSIKKCIPVLEEMVKCNGESEKLIKTLQLIYGGEIIRKECDKLRTKWQRLEHEFAHLTKDEQQNSKSLNAAQQSKLEIEKELTPALSAAGFEGIEDALSKRLKESDFNTLNKQLNDLNQALSNQAIRVRDLEKSLKKKKTGLSAEETAVLKDKFEVEKDALQELRKEWEEVKRALKNHADNLSKIARCQELIRQEEKTGRKWELLNQMIGDASGKRFNDFAQDLSLRRLLILANRRLSQLTDRYRIAAPGQDEDDSLVAIDQHMGGQRRSVKTLSGGETFILSLALALALADMAAKNVEINSLFIDEGFGTLDPETLDQTIDTLEKLQTESAKTIGIISHVEALKERIHTQIQLERNGQGYSSLKVVG